MTSGRRQPFIDSRAFDKANSTYVPFSSPTDAMLASLQLFHDVPCRIMDLVFSMMAHPDFDAKQLTLRNSVDVIDVVEEHRLKDRMVVVQKRSASGDDRGEQAGFPQFILDEVLDIIHAERMNNIKNQFEEQPDPEEMYYNSMEIEEDETLKAMTAVHRSWTTLAQKALGRVLHIGRPAHEMNILVSPVRKSIFGPWTSVVAVQFFHSEPEPNANVNDEYHEWFENLHRILVGFTNLKCLYITSYALLFTRLSNVTFGEMVRRNVRLEEIILYSMPTEAFDFHPLVDNAAVLGKNLRSLRIRGARVSDRAAKNAMRGPGFPCLNNVTIKCFFNLKADLRLLSILSSQSSSRLESLGIIDTHGRKQSFEEIVRSAFTPSQCVVVFGHLRSLHIDSKESGDLWVKWIMPYCTGLQSIRLAMMASLTHEILDLIPVTICTLDLKLWTKRRSSDKQVTIAQVTDWMNCLLRIASSKTLSKLKSFTLFLQRGAVIGMESWDHYEQQVVSFQEEMRTACEGVGIKCHLDM